MEFLKNTIVLAVLGFALTFPANAQTQSELHDAFLKSYTLESEKKYGEAIKTLMAVYSEESYEINLRLGWLNYLAARNNKAIQHYKTCIALMPVATEPLWGIIGPYSIKEDWVNVEKIYHSVLKLDPKNTVAGHRLGLMYYYRKNYTTAKHYFDMVLNLNPFDYDALLMSAWTHYFLGNMKDARVLFCKTLLRRPNDASALEGLELIK